MNVDFESKTVAAGPYTVTISAPPGRLRCETTYGFSAPPGTDPRHVQAVMAWAGGVPAGDQSGGTRSWSPDGITHAIEFPVAAAAAGPGPADLVITLWDSDPAGAKLVLSARLAGTAAAVPAPQLVPGRIVRSLFHLYPADLSADPALAAAVRAAGVNTLPVNVFENPVDGTPAATIDEWRAKMDALVKSQYDAASALGGFALLGIGDDLFRTAAEIGWYAAHDWARAAVVETAARMVAAAVIGVEMVDEVPGGPADNPEYAEACGWLRSVPGCPPFAWPNKNPAAWEASPLADYVSRYWSPVEWRNGRPDGSMTLYQMAGGIARAAAGRPAGKPWLCQVGAAGDRSGPTAADVVAQVWAALAHGCCGVRVYSYDLAEWAAQRAAGDPAAQRGTRPGDARWAGMAAAFAAVAAREGELTAGHFYPPAAEGAWLRGRRGGLAWHVNLSEQPAPSPAAGTLLTPAGESPVAAGGAVPSGGVVFPA